MACWAVVKRPDMQGAACRLRPGRRLAFSFDIPCSASRRVCAANWSVTCLPKPDTPRRVSDPPLWVCDSLRTMDRDLSRKCIAEGRPRAPHCAPAGIRRCKANVPCNGRRVAGGCIALQRKSGIASPCLSRPDKRTALNREKPASPVERRMEIERDEPCLW